MGAGCTCLAKGGREGEEREEKRRKLFSFCENHGGNNADCTGKMVCSNNARSKIRVNESHRGNAQPKSRAPAPSISARTAASILFPDRCYARRRQATVVFLPKKSSKAIIQYCKLARVLLCSTAFLSCYSSGRDPVIFCRCRCRRHRHHPRRCCPRKHFPRLWGRGL